MEDIANVDYTYAKRVCKDFEIKHLGEHHDSYVQSDTLLLADVFENFRNVFLEIYKPKFLIIIDPTKYLAASGLAW